jgi:hypothetical protein
MNLSALPVTGFPFTVNAAVPGMSVSFCIIQIIEPVPKIRLVLEQLPYVLPGFYSVKKNSPGMKPSRICPQQARPPLPEYR